MREDLALQSERIAVKRVIVKWARIIHIRFESFGYYLPHDECALLCKHGLDEEWNDMYPVDKCRLVLWDTTDYRLSFLPSERGMQRLMYCHYYKGHVCRGGVGMTACSWAIPGPLWTPISDTSYMEKSGIFQNQKNQAHQDGRPPFVNMTDKGMRDQLLAQKYGQRMILPSTCRMKANYMTPLECVKVCFKKI